MFSLPSPPTPPPLNNPLLTMPCLCFLFSSLFSLFFFFFFHVQTWNPEFRVPSSKIEDGTSRFGFNVQCLPPPLSLHSTTHPLPTMPCLFFLFFLSFILISLFFLLFPSSNLEPRLQSSILEVRTLNLEPRLQTSIFEVRRWNFEVWVQRSLFPPSPPTPPTHLPQ